MAQTDPQKLCISGQSLLVRMRYNESIAKLVEAERLATEARDWDTVSRLYMPLQEARRQRRQRCGEGMVRMDFVSAGPDDRLHPRKIIAEVPHGRVLVAGWGTTAPAAELRKLIDRKGLYLETFLAAAFPTTTGPAVAVVACQDDPLPDVQVRSRKQLEALLPRGAFLLDNLDEPNGPDAGNGRTLGHTMDLWDRLHAPFLSDADKWRDPVKRIAGYRKAIEVDYACEIAHQSLSEVARRLEQTGFSSTDARK